MRLKYVQGSDITVHFRDTEPLITVRFSPEAELKDEFALRLLNNPEHKGKFIVVKDGKLRCDHCDFTTTSKAGLVSHKRKHKEQTHETIS